MKKETTSGEVGARTSCACLSARIHADVQKVLADPEVKARYNTFAFEALNWSAAEIRKQAELKSKTYGKLVARKNITLE